MTGTPYCSSPGACPESRGPGGFGYDPASDLWVCAGCRRPSRAVYENSIACATVPNQGPGSPAVLPGGTLTKPLKLSNSEIQAHNRCKRKWMLGHHYGYRLRREGVGALSVGNMIHFPLEVYYADPNRDPATFDWRAPLDQHYQERLNHPEFPHDKAPEMQAEYELAQIMLAGYFQWLTEEGADSDIEVISAERELEVFFDTILGVPVYLIGKLDTEVRLKSSGLRAFMDHKSVQNVKDLPKQIEINPQLKYYGLLQRMEAVAKGTGEVEFAHGGMLNMLRKVKRTAKSNPPFYDRAGTTHNDEVYRTFHTQVWGKAYDLLTTKQRLDAGGNHQQVAPPSPGFDCDWGCPFKLICPRFDDGSDVQAILDAQYELHDPLQRYQEVEKG
jgi:hypothetical protein